jgi:hypothetical protein
MSERPKQGDRVQVKQGAMLHLAGERFEVSTLLYDDVYLSSLDYPNRIDVIPLSAFWSVYEATV